MSDETVVGLTERARRIIAVLLVGLAVVHLLRPDLGIDGVFLGLLGLAVVVLFFDIDSIDALGVKAKARKLRESTKDVESAELPSSGVQASVPPAPQVTQGQSVPASAVSTSDVVHREPFDLMPPVEPVARILWGVEQIRIEMIVLAGSAGHLKRRMPWGQYRLTDLAPRMADEGLMPREFVEPIKALMETRDALAHGRRMPSSLLDSSDELAMTLLARLRELPREYNRVRGPNLALFVDQSLTTPHRYSGVLLEKRNRDGDLIRVVAFPTEQEYRKGRFVTWEWDLSKGSDDEAWFMDPDSNSPVLAFSSAALFAGREFPEQWGLRYRGAPLLEE